MMGKDGERREDEETTTKPPGSSIRAFERSSLSFGDSSDVRGMRKRERENWITSLSLSLSFRISRILWQLPHVTKKE